MYFPYKVSAPIWAAERDTFINPSGPIFKTLLLFVHVGDITHLASF